MGMVQGINTAENSFFVVVAQSIAGILAPATIAIHVFLFASAQRPRPAKHLTVANDVFWRTLRSKMAGLSLYLETVEDAITGFL